MKKLEQLKKEMLDARQAYNMFKSNNSRELTSEEKKNEQQFPIFLGLDVKQTVTRLLELDKENTVEMRRLEQNMKDTYATYIKEFQNNSK